MNLVEARRNRGLSQREVALKIGINRGVLERAELGRTVQPRHAKAIADFYGVRVTDIWPLEGDQAAECSS